MNFDGKKWRAAVRAAFDDGTANRYGSGPWLPDEWYGLGWNLWKKGGMILEITEEKSDSQVTESGPTHGAGPRARTETVITETAHFIAEVLDADLWRGPPPDAPEGASVWWHGSHTAFGPGLYHCEGYISLHGTATYTSLTVRNYTPPEGGPTDSTVIADTSRSESHHVLMEYSTDPTELNGLATFCRIKVQQLLPPVAAFFSSPYPWFTQPSDPDGVVSDPTTGDPDDIREEVYWTDAALAKLAEGGWSANMVLLGDSMTVPSGPNADGIDNGDFQSEVWSRSGTLTLTVG